MSNRHELENDDAAVARTLAALNNVENELCGSETDRETRLLGKAIRDSLNQDIPDSSETLRESVLAELDRHTLKRKDEPEHLAAKTPARIRMLKWAGIGGVGAAVVACAWIVLSPQFSRVDWNPMKLAISDSEQFGSKATTELSGENDQKLAPRDANEIRSGKKNKTDLTSDEAKHLFALPGAGSGQQIRANTTGTNLSTSIDSYGLVVESKRRSQFGDGGGGFGGRSGGEWGRLGRSNGDSDHFSTPNNEQYDSIIENRFIRPQGADAISTFSIDVDTASYSNVRRFINSGQRPPKNAVRIEEMVNYFQYDYAQPDDDAPFSVNMEVAQCPWNETHQLLRIGIKGKEIDSSKRPLSNIVFLVDVSGSMRSNDKLPLLKRAMHLMVDQLTENDHLSIVAYAGQAGVRLQPTSGDQKRRIHDVINTLDSGGSTHGSAGIEKAYELAASNFFEDGVNRVILATDGDLNVGITADDDLVELIKRKASEGVFLTVLGFGTGNLKDAKLEKLADNGNGIYAYIDGFREARKVLIEQMSSTLVTIAKDVKLQLEFNPAEVKQYRLIGYENRVLAREDFNNDQKDAGEIGAGHTVTALYELVTREGDSLDPANNDTAAGKSTKLKYQSNPQPQEPEVDDTLSDESNSGELLTLALRFKKPDEDKSNRLEFTIAAEQRPFDKASTDFRFAASVAAFGMLLRDSEFRGNATLKSVVDIASRSIGDDKHGYRSEFIDLVRQAR